MRAGKSYGPDAGRSGESHPAPRSHFNVRSPAPVTERRGIVPILNPQISDKIGILQSLDDAIAFRLNRLNLPCQDCTAGRKCIDHAYDVDLMARYQDRYAEA